MPGYDLKMRISIFIQNVVVIGIFLLAGFWMDHVFATKHLYLILALFVSFPVNQVITILLIKKRFNGAVEGTEMPTPDHSITDTHERD